MNTVTLRHNMKLVIVESPSKAKTINKYLGNEYRVLSSVGHIIDLPKSKLGVDVANDFEPQYDVIPGKDKVIKSLRSEAKGADEILLATDPDREGEAISWHIRNVLKNSKKPISRIEFHEITKPAIEAALKKPREIDDNLVNAQQARRILDRLVGYTLSPLIWKKIRYGLSAGRVQSVALKLIVDRERERRAFVAEEYWSFMVVPSVSDKGTAQVKIFLKDNEERPEINEGDFILDLKKIDGKKAQITSELDFSKYAAITKLKASIIKSIEEKTITKRPNPPFTTSTFQQAAVNTLNMTSSSAMRAAQKLYEAGLITYMRTDSFSMSPIAMNSAREVIQNEFGAKYVPEKTNFYKTSSKSAQEAHEAIRPTNFATKEIPASFGIQEKKVYDLIYKRALASQMSNAIYTQKSLIAELDGDQVLTFSATAQKNEFDGWLKLYKVSENKKLIKIIESLKVGTELSAEQILGVQHFTEPPARYTEASLIKALEKNGIGRPSTYASIVSVIMQRTYVEKDGKYFYPTDMGFVVTDLLANHFQNIVDLEFTANMENDLDRIADGEKKWKPVIKDFFLPFQELIKIKDKEINKEDLVVLGPSEENCELCGKPMVKKLGKYGTFLSCSNFPDCKGIKSLTEAGGEDLESKAGSEEFLATYKSAPKTDDGRDYALKKGRFGEFWAHPDYPKVKDIKSLEYTDKKKKELFGEAPLSSDKKVMILRKGKFGYFWAHPDYPEVKEIMKAGKPGATPVRKGKGKRKSAKKK